MARKSRKNTGAAVEVPVQTSNNFVTAIYARLSIENSGKDDAAREKIVNHFKGMIY